jgi:hypothetical protein
LTLHWQLAGIRRFGTADFSLCFEYGTTGSFLFGMQSLDQPSQSTPGFCEKFLTRGVQFIKDRIVGHHLNLPKTLPVSDQKLPQSFSIEQIIDTRELVGIGNMLAIQGQEIAYPTQGNRSNVNGVRRSLFGHCVGLNQALCQGLDIRG